MDYRKILRDAIKKGSSDIHIVENEYPRTVTNNSLEKIEEKFTSEDFDSIIRDYKVADTLEKHSKDFAVSFEGTRIRCNSFKTLEGRALSIRILPSDIPTFERLNIYEQIRELSGLERGLVIISGVTGSGKSTTLASIINSINKTKAKRIVTLEDPIEYVYQSEKSMISQREIGTHVESFSTAVRDAMRQSPDILLVGEMRDKETIEQVLHIAKTGHLVFATLHTDTSVGAIDRIVSMFPEEQQKSVRFDVSNVLEGVVHQTLLRGKAGNIVMLAEVLRCSTEIRNGLEKSMKPENIRDYLRYKEGCLHRADCAKILLDKDSVTEEQLKGILSETELALAKRKK